MKKTVLDLFRFSAILLAAVPSVLRADIDFSAFAHKAYITFSGYEGETTLTNFPALVRLADGVGGFAHADCALAGGRDVRFSLGDGRELPSEVVSWNEDGTSEFYVRVPELAGKSTRIMVFWGSAAAPARDPRLKVWDRSYTGVYGMGDAGRALVDASSSDILGAVPGTVTDATGIVGTAKGFAEANKTYYTVGMPQEIPNYYLGSTMECWFKVAAFPSSDNRPMVAFYPTAGMYNMGIVFRMRSSGKISANMGYSSSNGGDNYGTELTSAVAEAGVWHHAMVTFATDRTLTLYLDGARAGSTVRSKPRFPTDAILNSHTVLIGSGGDNGNWRTLYFDGILDEVRLSTIARPADYAAAVYKNLADTADFLVIEATPATATAIEADSILRGEADGVRYVTDGDDAIYADGVAVASAPANARHVVTSHPLKKQYRVMLSAGAGGTVTPSGELWLDAGSVLDISATASNAAHAFYAWDGNCPTLEVFTASIRLPVTEPRALKAVFGTALYVKPAAEGGDDEADGLSEATAKATPWGAVHAVGAHPAYAPAVVLVADGVYNTTNTVSKSASVTLSTNIALRAVHPGKAAINLLKRGNVRGVYLNHFGAVADGLVVTNGNGNGWNGYGICFNIARGHVQNALAGFSSMGGYHCMDVQLDAGWLRATTITGNRTQNSGDGMDGALYTTGGLVDSCVITGNVNQLNCALGGNTVMRNCLVAKNTANTSNAGYNRGGGVIISPTPRNGTTGGTTHVRLDNCTIADNYAKGYGGGVFASSGQVGAFLVNCAVSGNTTLESGNGPNLYGPITCVATICPDADSGNGNFVATPAFAAAEIGDYTPTGVSRARDAVPARPWALDPAACDLAGTNRVLGTALDLGCYEYVPDEEETLDVNVDASVLAGIDTVTTAFSAALTGAGAQGVTYLWDFGDGTTSTEAAPTHTYACGGYYTVTLTVTDVADPTRTATFSQTDMIKVTPSVAYVRAVGESTPKAPYATPATAANTLQAAYQAAPARAIDVGEGTISIGTESFSVKLPIEICGKGPERTIINAANGRLTLSNRDAVLADLTIRNAPGDWGTGMVTLHDATVTNCVLRDGSSDGSAAIQMHGGRVSGCVIRAMRNINGRGGGIRVDATGAIGNLVENTVISNCTSDISGSNNEGRNGVRGAAVWAAAPLTMRNCLVSDNLADTAKWFPYNYEARNLSSAIYSESSLVLENCTIAGNRLKQEAEIDGAAVYAAGDGLAMTNTVVWGNVCTNIAMGGAQTVRDVFVADGKAASFSHCDFAEAGTIASASVTTDACFARDPLFRDAPGGNFTFGSASPLVNAGVRLPWMDGARDLDGYPRLLGRPDIGCFESQTAARTLLLVQ